MRQSDDGPVYAERHAALAAAHGMYDCACSRKELGPGPYRGRCRERGLAPGRGRGLRIELGGHAERFHDALLGAQVQEPAAQSGDQLLRDRLGNWTYQFAVVVDDFRQGVDLVIRGADLLDSTGRQIALARMVGRRAPPVFLHHPLILKPSGEKLSKASRDTGLRDLRAAGRSPERVLGEAAFRSGMLPHARQLPADKLATLFRSQPAA